LVIVLYVVLQRWKEESDGRIEKIVEKMIHRPNGVRFREIANVLEHHGYIEVRESGSHHHFRNRKGDLITIPNHNPIKAVYDKEVLRRIGRWPPPRSPIFITFAKLIW
jgi:predicted RNA binding protein YcfA (HicA-like mRNA interferase family)